MLMGHLPSIPDGNVLEHDFRQCVTKPMKKLIESLGDFLENVIHSLDGPSDPNGPSLIQNQWVSVGLNRF
jgi:hypothetical protein